MMPLRFALLGAGFWARFQLAGWGEVGGVECVAVFDRSPERAHELARLENVPSVYDDVGTLLRNEGLDFVDIVTNPESHCEMVEHVAARGLPVICQKPMAPSLKEAERMVSACHRAGVPFYIHENWRWQAPIRQLKAVLSSGAIGRPFRARIRMASGFKVFENQPSLRDCERFLIADIGSHILDVARFLFGEAASVYTQTSRVQPDIRGEDVATVLLRMRSGTTVICEMGYAGAPLSNDCFPQTVALIEGEKGCVDLSPGYRISITTASGTDSSLYPPPQYSWADRNYDVVHASIVPCHADLLSGLRGQRRPETTGEDNYQTIRLVSAAYDSASSGNVVNL